MEFQKVIESRRSIRKYDAEKKVSEEQIREMIQAAIYAPSWRTARQQDIIVYFLRICLKRYVLSACRNLMPIM